PDVASARSRTTFRTGLQARHNITSRIAIGAGIYYQHDENEGINSNIFNISGFDEDSFDAALSVRYAVTRYFGLEAGYNHTEVWSDIFLREYTRNRYFAGVNLTF
ncbi:MAG: outer membrane beta-barrel protein, partial [Verrucomicrobiaceae bacterium]|nr:outer membrane beta-barrel protein [Verrucomicrobiaceae bacterium]